MNLYINFGVSGTGDHLRTINEESLLWEKSQIRGLSQSCEKNRYFFYDVRNRNTV